jgi:GNAT superfamily N-acetyltransferase
MPITLDDLKIIPLTEDHDVSTFNCGDPDLNEFVQVDCHSYQSEYLSHTRLAFHEDRIVGYVTLLSDSIILKSKEKKKLFSFYGKIYFFPALKIARLGVQQENQKNGVGRALLEYSIGVAARLNHEMGVGCRFITVDAYPESVPWYEQRGFIHNKHLMNPNLTHPSMRFDLLKSTL